MKFVEANADTIVSCVQYDSEQMVVRVGALGVSLLVADGKGGYHELELHYEEWVELIKELGESFPPPTA